MLGHGFKDSGKVSRSEDLYQGTTSEAAEKLAFNSKLGSNEPCKLLIIRLTTRTKLPIWFLFPQPLQSCRLPAENEQFRSAEGMRVAKRSAIKKATLTLKML